ncbi:MAG: amidohydrolase family protein [Phycisphaeraceae bacterium]
MATLPQTGDAPATTTAPALSLIDCDVHNTPRDAAQDILPHLPAYYRHFGLRLPGGPGTTSPIGVGRADATPARGGPPGSCPQTMREQLIEPFGIDYVILTGGGVLAIGVHGDADYAAAVASAANEWMLTWMDEDPRFYGSIFVAPQNPAAAAAEIRKRGSHPRLVQVMMTSATRTPYGDRFYWPIYEAACEMGLPVAVHPGAECSGISNCFAPGYPASYFEWHSNISQNYMGQITSLVCRGVFNEFPQMKFVCVEGGIGWLPHLMWRLDKNWKSLRVSAPWLERPPSEYIVEHVRLSTQPIEEPERPEHLLQIFEMVHAEKTVMFASDYPHWDNDSPVHGLPKLPDALARRIYVDNARELYNLPDVPAVKK